MKKFVALCLFLFSLSSFANNELIKQLVEVSSGSNDVEGVTQVQNIFAEQLEAAGLKVEKIPYPNGKLGPLVVGTLIGSSKEFVTMIVHADTVFEKSSGFLGFQVAADGKTAKGPGAIDAKGGMVVILNALKQYLPKNKIPKYSLRIVSSPAEEVGAPDFLAMYQNFSKDSILVLGFEPCLEDGSVIDSRRGNRWYKITVTGREAHAGRAHREGINACWELSKKLDAISKLTDYKKDLTVSIGRIEGGKDKYNIVCGEASAKIDMRFSDTKVRDEAQKNIEKIVAQNSVAAMSDRKKVDSKLEITDDTPPFSTNKQSLKYIQQIKSLVQKHEGKKVSSQRSGGAADASYFSRPGLAIIDGLGACGGKIHTPEEFINLQSLETRAQVLADFLNQL